MSCATALTCSCTFLNTVLLLRMPLLSLGVPLWITERTQAPAWLVSALFVLNTGAVMVFQVRMARGVTGLASATRAIRRSGLVMLVSCAVFALSAGASPWVAAGVLVAGAVLQVVAEMQQSAGSWQVGFDLAPADRMSASTRASSAPASRWRAPRARWS